VGEWLTGVEGGREPLREVRVLGGHSPGEGSLRAGEEPEHEQRTHGQGQGEGSHGHSATGRRV
jgi:hypothetical protein